MNLDFLLDTIEVFGREMTVGTLVLIIASILGAVLLLVLNVTFLIRKKQLGESLKGGSPERDELGWSRPKPITPTPPQPQSIEELYAKNNGLCVCPFCETMNAKDNTRCCACGSSLPK